MSKGATDTPPRKRKILVIEDDRSIREGLSMNLGLHGYEVLTASDGEEGMTMAFNTHPDLVILDIMMPYWSGLDILEELRKHGENVPVLILSARDKTADKVEGLDTGADDYMIKPFDLPELMARVEAMIRRQRREEESRPKLVFGDLIIDPSLRNVHVKGREIVLSAREFNLLFFLASSPDQVFTRETILEKVWGWDYEGTPRTVDNFIANLRKKIESGGKSSKYFETLPRVGYRFRKGKE